VLQSIGLYEAWLTLGVGSLHLNTESVIFVYITIIMRVMIQLVFGIRYCSLVSPVFAVYQY